MEKQFKLQNIITDIIDNVKKQDFLVYFRKISILDISKDNITFWVMSWFMKDNLEAKFYNVILNSAQKECPNIKNITFQIDINIDNPWNKDVIDCTSF